MVRLWSIVDLLAAFFLIVLLGYKSCNTEKVTYLSTEHPRVTYFNEKYVKYVNITSRRWARHNRNYYVDLHWDMFVLLNNSFKVDFFFYEFSTNVYKPTILEMHWGFCDLVLKDKLFGSAMRRELKMCPLPAGAYHLYNMTVAIEHIPDGFPFTKGRIYANCTYLLTKEVITMGYIDMELKQYTVKKTTGNRHR